MTLHLVRLNKMPILEQLQLEEALLRADHRNWCLLNTHAPPAIVMGISGNPHLLINQSKWQEHPVPLIRRFSGGGTVFVDEDTYFVTWIFNHEDADTIPFPEPILQWSAAIYQPLFTSHPFALKENDYIVGERKFGGNAQSITKQRWLLHSSLLWDFRDAHMDYLHLPPKMPVYRQQRAHTDFLCKLKEYWPAKEEFQKIFESHIQQLFLVQEVSEEETKKVLKKPHRSATQLIHI